MLRLMVYPIYLVADESCREVISSFTMGSS
jgi:hypothetical protein